MSWRYVQAHLPVGSKEDAQTPFLCIIANFGSISILALQRGWGGGGAREERERERASVSEV